MAPQELKRLQVLRENLEEELSQVKTTKEDAAKKLQELSQKKKALDCQIRRLSQNEVVVSEHALLRYFVRVKGFDLKIVEQEILSEQVRKQIEVLRSGRFPTSRCILKAKDGVITTVLSKNGFTTARPEV